MAYVTKQDQLRYIELGCYSIDFNEGDVLFFDNVKDISPFFPLESSTILFAACTSGQQVMESEGNSLDFSKGNIMHCPSKLRVTCGWHSDDFNCKVLCLSEQIVHRLLRDKVDLWQHESAVRHLHIVPISPESFNNLMFYSSIISSKLKRSNPSEPYEIVLALLRVLLLELYFRLCTGEEKRHDQRLSQGRVLFNRFLALVSNSKVKRQPISTYASQLAITPKYLTMLCLKYSNKTALDWVAQYTVEEIRFYLKSTELSIKEISALLGFSNMSHFGSYVRKHLGVSPSEYRFSKKH